MWGHVTRPTTAVCLSAITCLPTDVMWNGQAEYAAVGSGVGSPPHSSPPHLTPLNPTPAVLACKPHASTLMYVPLGHAGLSGMLNLKGPPLHHTPHRIPPHPTLPDPSSMLTRSWPTSQLVCWLVQVECQPTWPSLRGTSSRAWLARAAWWSSYARAGFSSAAATSGASGSAASLCLTPWACCTITPARCGFGALACC